MTEQPNGLQAPRYVIGDSTTTGWGSNYFQLHDFQIWTDSEVYNRVDSMQVLAGCRQAISSGNGEYTCIRCTEADYTLSDSGTCELGKVCRPGSVRSLFGECISECSGKCETCDPESFEVCLTCKPNRQSPPQCLCRDGFFETPDSDCLSFSKIPNLQQGYSFFTFSTLNTGSSSRSENKTVWFDTEFTE